MKLRRIIALIVAAVPAALIGVAGGAAQPTVASAAVVQASGQLGGATQHDVLTFVTSL